MVTLEALGKHDRRVYPFGVQHRRKLVGVTLPSKLRPREGIRDPSRPKLLPAHGVGYTIVDVMTDPFEARKRLAFEPAA